MRQGCGASNQCVVRMRWVRCGHLAVVCSLLLTGHAPAESGQRMLEDAIQEYTTGLDTSDHELRVERFRRALRLFAQTIEERKVENADLYANLGNAALQCEQLGQAVLAYRRALATEPGHTRARQNLNFARERLPNWVPRPRNQTLLDTFFFWHQTLSPSERSMAATCCFAVAATLLALAFAWKKLWARNVAVLPALFWLALTGLSAWETRVSASDDVVVTAPEVVARAADSTGAPARFAQPLPGGTEARVLERRTDWARIRLADGRDAWVRASSLGSVYNHSSP